VQLAALGIAEVTAGLMQNAPPSIARGRRVPLPASPSRGAHHGSGQRG